MKKKLFALIMAMVMILSLAACGGDNNGSGKGAAAVDTNTVAVGAVVIARDDIPEDLGLGSECQTLPLKISQYSTEVPEHMCRLGRQLV